MAIVLARVDNRLIHGQVVEAWLPTLGAEQIFVADDVAHADVFRRAVMEMAVPPGVSVRVEPVDEAVAAARSGAFNSGKVILLFATIDDAQRAHRSGLAMRALNVGVVPHSARSERVTQAVYLTQHEAEVLLAMRRDGVELNFRSVPSHDPGDVTAAVERIAGRGGASGRGAG